MSFQPAPDSAALLAAPRPDTAAAASVATLPGHVEASGPARLLFEQDKLYTVVAVLLIVWLGVALLLLHNDRRLARLEKQAPPDGPLA